MRGLEQVMRNLNAKLAEIKVATVRGLNEVGLDLKGLAIERAPIDTGDLRGSCSVDPAVENGKKIKVKVRFAEPYALEQHENMQYRHPQGGGPKYLENPLKENTERYIAHVKSIVRRVMQ